MHICVSYSVLLPSDSDGKESACKAGDPDQVSNPCIRKIPWRRAWQPIPVFLPEESHGQKSLAGYSPQYYTEFYMTEATEHAHQHDFWEYQLVAQW